MIAEGHACFDGLYVFNVGSLVESSKVASIPYWTIGMILTRETEKCNRPTLLEDVVKQDISYTKLLTHIFSNVIL